MVGCGLWVLWIRKGRKLCVMACDGRVMCDVVRVGKAWHGMAWHEVSKGVGGCLGPCWMDGHGPRWWREYIRKVGAASLFVTCFSFQLSVLLLLLLSIHPPRYYPHPASSLLLLLLILLLLIHHTHHCCCLLPLPSSPSRRRNQQPPKNQEAKYPQEGLWPEVRIRSYESCWP